MPFLFFFFQGQGWKLGGRQLTHTARGRRDDAVGGGEIGARTRKYRLSPQLLYVEMGIWRDLKITM